MKYQIEQRFSTCDPRTTSTWWSASKGYFFILQGYTHTSRPILAMIFDGTIFSGGPRPRGNIL